jgi:tetratricopeptide (TPR) repeat protein
VEQPDALRKRQQTVQDLLVGSAKALGQELKDQPQVRAELQGVLGRLLHNLALGDEAIAVRQQRVDQLQALHAPPAELAQAWRELADSQDMRGDVKAAGDSLRQGLALCRDAGMAPPALCWGMQAALGWQDVLAGKLPQARAQIDPALAQLRRLAPGSAELAEALALAGDAMVFESDVLGHDNPGQAAYALRQESTELRARLWGQKSVRLARNRYQLGMSLWLQGRLALASDELARAEQDMAQAMGPTHTDTLEVALHRAWLEVLVDLNPNAMHRLQHAANALMANKGDLDPRTQFDVVTALGECLLHAGDMAEAFPYLTRAIALARKLDGQVLETGRPETNLAWYLQDVGQFESARNLLNQAHQKLRMQWGSTHPATLDVEDRLHDLDVAQYGETNPAGAANAKKILPETSATQRHTQVEAMWRGVSQGRRQNQYMTTVLTANEQMGQLAAKEGDCERALPYFRRAMLTLRAAHPDSPYLLLTRLRTGLCLVATNRMDEAEQLLRQAEARLAKPPRLGPHLVREVLSLKRALRKE